ncbi:MAG: SRPBCC family protein [Acidimicrobiales bacterium]|nr:SRPBCC family protein [Acidimicrobiales bacterium]
MTTTTHPDTTVVADDTVPAIHITREFNSSAAAVFRAHTDPDIFARWCGPHDLTTTIGTWDARTGGAWSYQSSDAEGNQYGFYGSFHEIRPDELIVQTFTFAGYPDGVALERVTFEELDDGRCRLRAMSLVDSFEARDAMISSGMEHGVKEGYEKLDKVLEGAHG